MLTSAFRGGRKGIIEQSMIEWQHLNSMYPLVQRCFSGAQHQVFMPVIKERRREKLCALKDCYLGLDFGTSGARACVIDGQVCFVAGGHSRRGSSSFVSTSVFIVSWEYLVRCFDSWGGLIFFTCAVTKMKMWYFIQFCCSTLTRRKSAQQR